MPKTVGEQTVGEFLGVDVCDDAAVDAVIPLTSSNQWLDEWVSKHPEAAGSKEVDFFTSRPMSREDARAILLQPMPDRPGSLGESGTCLDTR
jgi:hypothetical protein